MTPGAVADPQHELEDAILHFDDPRVRRALAAGANPELQATSPVSHLFCRDREEPLTLLARVVLDPMFYTLRPADRARHEDRLQRIATSMFSAAMARHPGRLPLLLAGRDSAAASMAPANCLLSEVLRTYRLAIAEGRRSTTMNLISQIKNLYVPDWVSNYDPQADVLGKLALRTLQEASPVEAAEVANIVQEMLIALVGVRRWLCGDMLAAVRLLLKITPEAGAYLLYESLRAWDFAIDGNERTLEQLLDCGVNPDEGVAYGRAPLLEGAFYRRTSGIRLLAERGADINVTDRYGSDVCILLQIEIDTCRSKGFDYTHLEDCYAYFVARKARAQMDSMLAQTRAEIAESMPSAG